MYSAQSIKNYGLLLSALACLAATGCGNGLARVKGQITLNGSPLACNENVSGTVCFYPQDGLGVPAIGRIDEDGNYRISTGAQSGIAPGAYLVTVRASEFLASNDANFPRSSKMLTPSKFNDPKMSGFRADVGPGSNTFDFDLQGQPERRRRR